MDRHGRNGIDPAEVRLRNIIPTAALLGQRGWCSVTPVVMGCLRRALDLVTTGIPRSSPKDRLVVVIKGIGFAALQNCRHGAPGCERRLSGARL